LLFQAYDKHLEQLSAVAERVCRVLSEAGIEYRIVGGLAVLFHVESRDPLAARLTKDVDLAVARADLPRITEAVRSLGLEYRHVAGVDMFVDAKAPKTQSGVHLVFVQKKFFSEPTVNDAGILLVSPAELVRMKLISFRQRDKTHIIDMDSVGLITPEIEAGLSEPLRDRLQRVRAEEAQSTGVE
jgi:hypothetical protein